MWDLGDTNYELSNLLDSYVILNDLRPKTRSAFRSSGCIGVLIKEIFIQNNFIRRINVDLNEYIVLLLDGQNVINQNDIILIFTYTIYLQRNPHFVWTPQLMVLNFLLINFCWFSQSIQMLIYYEQVILMLELNSLWILLSKVTLITYLECTLLNQRMNFLHLEKIKTVIFQIHMAFHW